MRHEQHGVDDWLTAPPSESAAAVQQLVDSAEHVLEIDVRCDTPEPPTREGGTPLKVEHCSPRSTAAVARRDLSEIVENALSCAG